jgi:bifunctional DNA-binding transcriptional regulator/antitoxin component of YhaV-PrlF toxin-antitoxin module
MPKVTSKLQLTVPKAMADEYGIRPGDQLDWIPAGETIRVVLANKQKAKPGLSAKERLELFDRATERQRRREASTGKSVSKRAAADRGWKREDLYNRGISR